MPLFENIEEFKNVSPGIQWAIFIVGCLILVVAAISVVVSIWLSIKYVVYNRRTNSRGCTGRGAARTILDKHGLQHINVSVVGSLLFGNSYSHYFKKVRLRRLTAEKTSITALAMGAEKSALAILDKEGDKDMRARVILTPLMYLGPFALIPIVAIGVFIDVVMFSFAGKATVVAAVLGLGIYAISFALSVMTLKTEKKAQARACEILREENMATEEEIGLMQELFRLYNIQYINDIIMELLQMILKVLEIVAKAQHNSASNSN